MPDKPIVLVTEGSHPTPMNWLREQADVLEFGPDEAGFDNALGQAQGMIVRTYTTVDAAMLDKGPNLKVVGRGGVGIENIDVAASRERGVEVVYTPDANTRSVADLVAGFMVKLVRPWHANHPDLFDAKGFKNLRKDAGKQLSDLTLGILGLGRVGSMVARMARLGFDMNVVYHDLVPIESDHGQAVSFDELLTSCDILTVHVDGRKSNKLLLDSDVLNRATIDYLINTSRGMVVDSAALLSSVQSGKIRGAALDVFDPEPPLPGSADEQLSRQDNVLLTPHMASRTERAMENMSWVVRDVMNVIEGREAKHPAP